jgi:uncharacterized membrane protein
VLSEREQRMLHDMELRMTLEDPHFVAVMAGRQALSWRQVVATYLVTVAVVLTVVLTALAGLYVVSACVATAVTALLLGYGLAAWTRHPSRQRIDFA